MNLNWVDGVVVVLVFLYVWQAWEKSAWHNFAEMLAWLVAYFVFFRYGASWQRFMMMSLGVMKEEAVFGGYLVIIPVVQQTVYWTMQTFLEKLPRQYVSKFWHGFLSVGPSLVSACLLVTYILLVLIGFPYKYPIQNEIAASWWGRQVHLRLLN